jgi:type 1 fimbria pilin
MSLIIYKISSYLTGRGSGTFSGGGSTTADFSLLLSNYYTKTELQTSGSASVHFDNITNAYHNNLLGLEGGSVADNSSGESSGMAGEYYHLSKAQYDALGTVSDLWLEDSIGDLYTVTSGAGVYIDDIFIKNSSIESEGNIYLVPTDDNGDSKIYLGNASSPSTNQYIYASGSAADVWLRILAKGDGTIIIGNSGSNTSFQIYSTFADLAAPLFNINAAEITISDGNTGLLPAKTTETDVVYYDPATGKLSYGTP